MKKQDIINALKKGKYEIRREYDCDCRMNWLIKDGQLYNDYYEDSCWLGNILYVKRVPIAQYIRYEKPESLIDTIAVSDIPDEIWNDMMISEIRTRGEGINPLHDKKERQSLIDYLTNLVSQGWKMYIDSLRGFANEYILYLVSPGSSLQDPVSGVAVNLERLSEIKDVEKFAIAHLWEGDSITDSYSSTIVLE